MADKTRTTSTTKSRGASIAALQKLADSPSPAAERAKLGDEAKLAPPTQEEQRIESERADAIRELEYRGFREDADGHWTPR